MDKKGQTNAGLITSIVMGVAGLVIAVIIAFLIIGTLLDANLLTGQRITTTVANETIVWINTSGYTLAGASQPYLVSFAVIEIWNVTEITGGGGVYTTVIPITNATISNAGVITNASTYTYTNASVSYTYTQLALQERSANALSGNFTDGVGNVSEQIPTVLLIAAIVLILGILAILVGVWQKMRMGGGSL